MLNKSLNTLHDGAFTESDPLVGAYYKIKEQGDIHHHHYSKGENPDDKKKKDKEAKEAEKNGNGNGHVNGNGNGNGNGGSAAAPPPAEAAPPPPEDPGNTMAKFSKEEIKRIKSILKKDKEGKEPELKLDKKKEKVNTKPKMKDVKVQEQINKLHQEALVENARIDLKNFAQELSAYSAKSGGIDKNYFDNVASIAAMGKMPGRTDIDNDTDPRDKVLELMTKHIPLNILKNMYKGISPAFDHVRENVAYLKNKEGHVFHISKRDKKGDAYSMHVADPSGKKVKDWGSHPSLSGAKKFAGSRGFTEEVDFEEAYTMHKGMKVKNVPRSAGKDAIEDNKKRREAQRKRAGLDEARKSDYELYHKDFSSAMQHAYDVAKKRGYTVDPKEIDDKVATGPRKPSNGKSNRYILGTDKKQHLHVQVANLDNKRYELNMYIEDVNPEENTKMENDIKELKEDGLKTMSDGAFTSHDPLRDAYSKMIAQYNEVNPYSGEEIKKDEEQLNEKEVEESVKEKSEIDESDKQYRRYEGQNQHGKAAVYAWKKYHDRKNPKEVSHGKELKAINKRHDERGHLSHSDGQSRYKISKTYTDRMSAKHAQKEEVVISKNISKLDKIRENRIKESKLIELMEDAMAQIKRAGFDDIQKRGNLISFTHEGKTFKWDGTGGQVVSPKKLTLTKDMLVGEGDKVEQKGIARKYDVEIKTNKGNYRYDMRSLDSLLTLMKEEKVIADGQGGAGEEGTDKATKKYKEDTPGQVVEGNIIMDSGDDFRKFEHMVEYLMGVSVKYPENFQMFQIEDTPNYRIEHEHGPIATITETDVRNFMGPNIDMEMFIDMAKGWGLNITTPDQTHVVGDRSPGEQIVTKDGSAYNESRQTPQEYADEYSKRYTIGGQMDQLNTNLEVGSYIEELAKRMK